MDNEKILTGEFGEKEKVVDTEMVKCPSCGANMVFDPEKQSLICEHCETVVKIEEQRQASELSIESGFNQNEQNAWKDAEVFKCSNCGAKVVLNKGETATKCPFCGTAHVEKSSELAGIKPNAVKPFSIGKEKAIEFGKIWARRRFFAPRRFKKSISPDNVSGIYAPSFTFDSKTFSCFTARIGYRHTRTVGSGKDRHTETWTEWRFVSGTHGEDFDDVLIASGSKINQKRVDKLSPFSTNESIKYEEKYLLGFSAYGYDKGIKDCWGQAKTKMDKVIRKNIKKKLSARYHYDELENLNVSTTHSDVTYKYVMLPVYVGNFNYKSKLFNFFVNGETGKVCGKTPKSALKIALTVLLGLAVVGGFVLLYLLT